MYRRLRILMNHPDFGIPIKLPVVTLPGMTVEQTLDRLALGHYEWKRIDGGAIYEY